MGQAPFYLQQLLPPATASNCYDTRCRPSRIEISSRTNYYDSTFFPNSLNEWNIFKSTLLKFIRPICHPIFQVHHADCLKLLTRLRVGLSHLRKHKFRHNFRNTTNPLCSCGIDPETTEQYLLRCPFFAAHRKAGSAESMFIFSATTLTNTPIGNRHYNDITNSSILKCTINFILINGEI